MAYTFEQLLAADPSNPANIAQNASITIFAPDDSTMTPLAITDPTGTPLPNPFPVNANGFGPAFMHDTLDRVAWAGGGFTGFVTSYEGMKQVAVDAQAAAENAAATAGAEAAAVADAAIAGATDEATAAKTAAQNAATAATASANSAANAAALVGAPADTAIAAAVNGTGTATKAALNATYGPALGWDSSTQTSVGMIGDAVTLADAAMTSGSAALSAASGTFSANDVGKRIIVSGAGVSGAPLKTTIQSVQGTSGVTLTAAASATVAAAKAVYGTNDTAAFIAGVTAAAAKRRIFTLAAGRSYLIDPVTIGADNVRIHGYGATLISTMWATDNVIGLYVYGNNLEFRGFSLSVAVGYSTPQAGFSNYDIMRVGGQVGGAYASGLTIIDCSFPEAAAGVNAYKTSHVRIENCTVINSHGNSIGAVNCKEDVVINRNYCSNGNDDLIAVTADAGTGQSTARVSITGNNLDTTDAAAIKIAGADRVTIQGNNVKNTFTAAIFVMQDTVFNLQPSHRVTIVGNTIQDGGQCFGSGRSHASASTAANGIQVTSNAADCIIANNVITNSQDRAISVPKGNAGLSVTGNRIITAGGAGISMGSVTDATFGLLTDVIIANNFMRGIKSGIVVGSATNLSVRGNVIRSYSNGTANTGYRGVQYGYLKNASVVDNIIVNDDGAGATTFDSAVGGSVNLTVKRNGETETSLTATPTDPDAVRITI